MLSGFIIPIPSQGITHAWVCRVPVCANFYVEADASIHGKPDLVITVEHLFARFIACFLISNSTNHWYLSSCFNLILVIILADILETNHIHKLFLKFPGILGCASQDKKKTSLIDIVLCMPSVLLTALFHFAHIGIRCQFMRFIYMHPSLVCDLNRTPIVMAKHGGSCVHFSVISTCGRTSPETVSHPQRQPLPISYKISGAILFVVDNLTTFD